MRKLQSPTPSIKNRRLWSQSRLRAAVWAATHRPVIEPVEPRLMLSATMSYRSQKPDGSLDTAVTFETGGTVQDFRAVQTSLLQEGFAAPAYDLFLQVTGIQGESDDAKHKGHIDILSFNWGADGTGTTATGGGAGAGKSTLHELHVVSRVSKASPELVKSLATGRFHQEANLFVRKAGENPAEFLKINLDDVLVSSYQINGALLEEFTFNFTDAELEYRPQKPDGTLDEPIKVTADGPAQDFAPEQRSLFQEGSGVSGDFDYFLQIDGIVGESEDAKHKDHIDVLSFGWGGDATISPLGGGGGAGKTQFHEMHFVTSVSKASPVLMDFMAKGRHTPRARFAATRSGGTQQGEFYTIELTDLLVSSYQVKTTTNGGLLEEFTLSFSDFELTYRPTKADGVLDQPIKTSHSDVSVQDFAPEQQSLLDAGNVGTGSLDVFLKIDGVEGETSDSKHQGEIEVLSWSWGGDAPTGTLGGGGGAGKSSLQELHVVSRLSKASPQIMSRVSTGQHVPQADLVFRRSGGDQVEFLRIDLDDVLITGYEVTTALDGSLVEEYTLNFATAELAYSPHNPDGTLEDPVKFRAQGLDVEEFDVTQDSLIQNDYVLPASSVEYFLKVDGIPGESTDAEHKDFIDILSFSWGEDGSFGGFGGGGGAGKTVFHEAHFVSQVSKASPLLMKALATGMHIPQAVFHGLHSAEGFEFLEVKFTDVLVSSYQVVMGQHNQLTEEFTLNFGKAEVEYTPQKADGTGDQPVKFLANAVSVEDFKPQERSLLHSNVSDPASLQALLTVDGVKGESTSSKHKDAIDVLSFSWGGDGSAGTLGGGGGAGKSTLQELHVLTRLSKASPTLLNFMDDGRHIENANLFVRKAGGDQQEFYKIKLEDLIVSSYQLTTAQDGTLLEEFTFNYDKSSLDYAPQKSDGSLDEPIKFEQTGLSVDDFSPVQGSILQTAPIAPPAGLNLFLKIDGIDGESTDAKHKGHIEIESFSWGGDGHSGTSGGGGAGSGKTVYQELHFVARTSKATPRILDRLMKGQHTPGAELAIRNADGQEFLKVKLVDVLVSSYKVTTALDGTLLEEFTLSFGPATVSGTPIADAGGPYQVGDGQTVALDGTGSSDPDQDPATLTYEWDLDSDGVFGETGPGAQRGDEVGATPAFSAAGLFGPQTLALALRVTDSTGKTDTDTAPLTIIDVTPPETILVSGPPALTNQTSATFEFTGTDQGTLADQLTFSAEIDGAARTTVQSPLNLSGLADGVHSIKIYAKDQSGNEDPTPATHTWVVDTRPPVVRDADVSPTPTGSPITLTAKVSDVLTGASPIASARYSIDGGVTWLAMNASDGAFNSAEELVNVTFGPLPAGVYTVQVRGSDAAGNTSAIVSLTLPVFDPGKSVHGAGIVKTPPGSDPAHPNQPGIGVLAVTARYKRDDDEPKGVVTFATRGLVFTSNDLDYLVVSGNTARIAGSGKINGKGDYSFEVWMVDGPGRHGDDQFRIRIVDNATGNVVFDNGALTDVSLGSIRIS